MTRSNRTLNRLFLALTGLVLLGAAAVLVWPAASRVTTVIRPSRVELTSTILWVAAGVCAALIVLALAWILSRGRGRTRTAVEDDGVAIELGAIEHALRDALSPVPGVLAVDAHAHRLRGRTAVSVVVSTRRHADLALLLDRIRDAIGELDQVVGVEIPVLVRVVTGFRAGLARQQRAE